MLNELSDLKFSPPLASPKSIYKVYKDQSLCGQLRPLLGKEVLKQISDEPVGV